MNRTSFLENKLSTNESMIILGFLFAMILITRLYRKDTFSNLSNIQELTVPEFISSPVNLSGLMIETISPLYIMKKEYFRIKR